MNRSARLIARVAIFSALAVVVSWFCQWLPNVNLIFFVVFAAGFLWGVVPGIIVGALGMAVWSGLNPQGPAPPPVYIAQIAGMALCGTLGRPYRRLVKARSVSIITLGAAAAAGVLSASLYYGLVSAVDAWLFQPFWPRFATSALWSIPGIIANAVAFPLLLPALLYLYSREQQTLWPGATS